VCTGKEWSEKHNNKRRTETKTFSRANKKRELQWYGHVIRMAEGRKPRQILGARPIGKRGRGRPRKTWDYVIEELGRQKGKTVREIDKLAKDRKGFSRWTEDPDTGIGKEEEMKFSCDIICL
jgi:hypothetical protein